MASATTFYNLKPLDKKGQPYDFKQLDGKVVLVVNVASQCGFTPQYEGLEQLYKKYKDQGFMVLGFPSNQFAQQEPGTNEEIQQFCQVNYGVTFPVLAKIDVNGDDTDPVFGYLKKQKSGILGLSRIKWNFEKFLIDKRGEVVKRYMTTTKPEELDGDIEKLLNQ